MQKSLFENEKMSDVLQPALQQCSVSRSTFYLGDCLLEMDKIEDKSVDMILCDLPYGTTACKWDSIIDLPKMWIEYERIIKDNGAIVLTASQPFTSVLISSNYKMFREEIIWLKNKSGSGMQFKQKHIKVHESVLIFSKKGNYTYNPQKWLVAEKEFLTQRKTLKEFESYNNIYGKATRTRKLDDGERNPISIISCAVPINPANTKTYSEKVDLRYHPTQKPIDLMEYFIKTYSNEGEIVLDNCMGSGTTGVACKKTGRHFIGIEKDEKYFEIAVSRVSAYCG
jgi:site-specific DNA-methyltransferase (adenine-specific)